MTPLLDPLLLRALEEDLSAGDLTSEATVEPDCQAQAVAVAKSPLVVCGGDVFRRTFELVDRRVQFSAQLSDGAAAGAGDVIWALEGPARSLLMAERTALNFVQRLSGIASLTARYVAALPQSSRTRITDTRKTTPGLRALERYAIRVGGGHNHRDNLGSAVLIKDNHIAAAGGVTTAIQRARAHAPHTSRIEVEVENLAMLDAALEAGADIVMLDNFPPAAIGEAVARCRNRALVEVSGNITLERIAQLGALSVDIISCGALTHSVPAADISLRIRTTS